MSANLLYSTNAHLKLYIQQQYGGDVHYVWCSPCYDPAAAPRYSNASKVPPSSSPKDIYDALAQAVRRGDRHDPKIKEQRASFLARAVEWEAAKKITPEQRDDIVYLVEQAPLSDWRPLLYIVPRGRVEGRTRLVPMPQRAGLGDEFTVSDLRRDEFDVVEW